MTRRKYRGKDEWWYVVKRQSRSDRWATGYLDGYQD